MGTVRGQGRTQRGARGMVKLSMGGVGSMGDSMEPGGLRWQGQCTQSTEGHFGVMVEGSSPGAALIWHQLTGLPLGSRSETLGFINEASQSMLGVLRLHHY